MRKGIALLIALLFIAGALAIVGIVYEKSQKATSAFGIYEKISQNSLLLESFEDAISVHTKEINSSETLDILFSSSPMLSSEDGFFVYGFDIEPLSDKININILGDEKKRRYLETYINNICAYFDIKEPDFLLALIMDTIDKDSEERMADSEIAIHDRRFANGAIWSLRQFYKILSYYYRYTRDESVFLPDWSKFIYTDPDTDSIIDADRLSALNAYFLGLSDKDEEFDYEKAKKEHLNILKALRIERFKKGSPYKIAGKVEYKLGIFDEKLSFRYDISKNRMEYVWK